MNWQHNSISINFTCHYLERQTLADVRHPYLYDFSGISILLRQIYLNFQKNLKFPAIIMTWMLTWMLFTCWKIVFTVTYLWSMKVFFSWWVQHSTFPHTLAYCNRKAIENSLFCVVVFNINYSSHCFCLFLQGCVIFHQMLSSFTVWACLRTCTHQRTHVCAEVRASVKSVWAAAVVARSNVSVEEVYCELLLGKVWRRRRAPARKHFHLNLLTA